MFRITQNTTSISFVYAFAYINTPPKRPQAIQVQSLHRHPKFKIFQGYSIHINALPCTEGLLQTFVVSVS